MRPIYRCPENFRESLSTPTAIFAANFNGLFCSESMGVQNWKFVALPIPEIIGVLKTFGQSLDTPMHPFLPNL